ncbi:MAG: MFS transporter [Candidatus Hodarchaeales archaeon]|jgi:DHA1 family multidrug resistance protein-like MFS transporter
MVKTLDIRSFRLIPGSVDRDVATVLVINCLFTIPWGLIQPFLSPYFFELSKGDYFLTGLLNGLPFFTMVFSVFIFGWIVDKIGSKKVLVTSFIIFTFLFLTLIFITDPVLFFLDYVVMYSLLACFNPAVLKYASLTKKKDIFGSMAAATSLGYFIGAVASGWVYESIGMTTLFYMSIIFCIVGLFLALIAHDLRQSDQNPAIELSPVVNPENTSSTSTFAILVSSRVLLVLFIICLIHGFQGTFGGMFVSIYFLDELNTPAPLIGLVFGAATLAGTVVSHYVGKIGEKRGFKEILIVSYAAYFFVWISFFIFTSDYLIPALFYTIPIYVGIMVAGPAIVADRVSESKRGTFMGILGAFQNLGFAGGTIMGGLFGGIQGTLRWNFGLSAVMAVILIVIIAIFLNDGNKKSDLS